jgi:hypothetical protein
LSARSARSLRSLETWLQQEIVRPHERGARPARVRTASVILPSASLDPAARVAIYADAYFLRLLECLVEDYPAVQAIIGPRAFARLMRQYLSVHPSRHYSLSRLGTRLPDYLAGDVRAPRRALIRDVALVERAMAEVFDAQITPVLSSASLAEVPAADWEFVRLRPIDALRLLALEHRANAIVTESRHGRPLPGFERTPTWVVVYRHDYTVLRVDLTEPMFVLLGALTSGKTLGNAIRTTVRRFPAQIEALQAEMFGWFRDWVRDGLFQSLEMKRPAKRR